MSNWGRRPIIIPLKFLSIVPSVNSALFSRTSASRMLVKKRIKKAHIYWHSKYVFFIFLLHRAKRVYADALYYMANLIHFVMIYLCGHIICGQLVIHTYLPFRERNSVCQFCLRRYYYKCYMYINGARWVTEQKSGNWKQLSRYSASCVWRKKCKTTFERWQRLLRSHRYLDFRRESYAYWDAILDQWLCRAQTLT